MEENLNVRFKEKLKELYGDYQPITSKFGTSSFGEIASDLCISPSQFSKLISGSATEGMYMRSIRNVEQLIIHKNLLKQTKQLKKELNSRGITEENSSSKYPKKVIGALVFLVLIIGVLLVYIFMKNLALKEKNSIGSNDKHPLSSFYTAEENKTIDLGFLNEDEVQEYCPASAFEGQWKLAQPYFIPLPGSKKAGVYLLAKAADVTMVCSKFSSEKGRVLWGFEHLTHEIWVDKTREPLIPLYFDAVNRKFTEVYRKLDFEHNSNFVKIASIKSFYLDEFTIRPDSIYRKGQPSGRYLDFLDKSLANEYNVDVNYILKEVISDLTQTRCNALANGYNNPNDLKVHSVISFNCFYSINLENLGFGGSYPYTKTLELVKKNYSDNLNCVDSK